MNGLEKKALKIGLGGLAAALLMAGGQASAVTPCPADDPLTTLAAAGFTCQISDKIFSDFTFSTNLATHALFSINPTTGDVVVTFSRDGMNFPTGTNSWGYTVTVASSGASIVEHTLGVDTSTPLPLVTVTDQFTGNVSGSHTIMISQLTPNPQGVILSPGDMTQTVMLSALQPSGGQLNSITNDYAQIMESVPEPASLSLFGLGLFGLGFARRRRS